MLDIKIILILSMSACIGSSISVDDSPVVTVGPLGTARGKLITTFLGRQVSAFRGIPYAYQPQRFAVSYSIKSLRHTLRFIRLYGVQLFN